MTVEELIKTLRAFPPDMIVVTMQSDGSYEPAYKVEQDIIDYYVGPINVPRWRRGEVVFLT